MGPRRLVLDTNVLVSLYVFADSRFAPLRAQVDGGHWLALSSEACLGEWRRVLAYPIFALSESAQAQAYAAYADRTHLIAPADVPTCRRTPCHAARIAMTRSFWNWRATGRPSA